MLGQGPTYIRGIKLFSTHKVIGHRGAAAYAPENTLVGFDKAHELGCRFVEFDVMLSADAEPFVFHDDTLRRTTGVRGEFGLASSELLKTLDAGKWFSKKFSGEKIPTLRDVLERLAASDMQANIEIKPYPGFAVPTTIATLTYINRYWPQDKPLPLISSFNLDALRLCQSLSPEMPLALLLSKWQDNWLQLAEELHCYSIHLSLDAATQAHVKEIKQQGYAVCVYTVNSKRKANKLLSWGVDAVFSDYPDLLV